MRIWIFCFLTLGLITARLKPRAALPQENMLRREIPLNGKGWHVWQDEKADWAKDKLYGPGDVPPLDQLPVNAPTRGWEILDRAEACQIPASIEELFSHGVNSWQYHGVSWFATTVDIPSDWKGRTVRLLIGKARLRVELYINGKLAGYDLCCETPLNFDITRAMKWGQSNHIAIRLTNPGGNRGWEDFFAIKWGDYELPPSHDYTGIDDVRLVDSPPAYIDDVFVENVRPAAARQIAVHITLKNNTLEKVTRELSVAVQGTSALIEQKQVPLEPGDNSVTVPMTVPDAELWDINSIARSTRNGGT